VKTVVAEDGTVKKEKKEKKDKKEIKGKKNRLIIRNLVFDVSDKHLRKLLEPFGKIAEIEIPKNPNNEKLNKGFAFAEFANYRSCEKAIKELNQSKFKGRNIVLDFSLSKQKFMTKKMEEGEVAEK
jgi:RNA recognition motif-containing protein